VRRLFFLLALAPGLIPGSTIRLAPVVRVIEDFDDGAVQLVSYSAEDSQPDAWALDSLVTYDSSRFSLRLFGNTWKLESISPLALDTGTVWQVAARVESVGDIQGFGLVDSAHTLFYAFAGTELLNTDTWITVYQGAFAVQAWGIYQLPVGRDWLARFGYLPGIWGLVFVNDRETNPRAKVYFDEISDITDDLPIAPQVEITHSLGPVFRNALGKRSVTVQFHSRVIDPDSPNHQYFWYFGDTGTSNDSAPSHTYVIEDDHDYTVLLEVADSTGMWGRATCEVAVDPGPTTFPVRLNFVGDIMLARNYDNPGGLIDTLGVDGIFDPTLPYMGDAADLTVANLECPLTAQGTPHPTKPIVFRGKPRNAEGLAHAGIDVLSQANNHATDYGLVGLRETQDSLWAHGILFSGAGANAYEAFRPVFVQRSGVNIAFLASCNRTGQYDNYQPYLDAGFNKPGFALLDSFNLGVQIRAVSANADRVVVETHSGIEYSPVPLDGRKPEIRNPRLETPEDEFYSPRDVEPDLHDIALRHEAIDLGADLVVNHHPHILQGLEVYRGKLIAHSLGNFAFDLTYAECFPSVILNAQLDASGFFDFSLTPVWIDHWIPRRAEGELGRHLLDYLARRSRDLGTYVTVNRDSANARIVLDTLGMTRGMVAESAAARLAPESLYWTSQPLRLARQGSIAHVSSVTPGANWQFRLGRDAAWFGNFENEGSAQWLLNQSDERYDTFALRGLRSLRQTRATGSGQLLTNLANREPSDSASSSCSVYGSIRTENARNANVAVRCYSSRAGGAVLGARGTDSVSGTADWGFRYRDFSRIANTAYYDICLLSDAPVSDTGRSWFDDVGIIEWGGWQTLSSPTAIPAPNDYYWIQVRTPDSITDAEVVYQEATFNAPQSAIRSPQLSSGGQSLRSFRISPNPCRTATLLRYNLTRESRVVLRVYNALGQEVRTLVNGLQPACVATVVWDGRDNLGRVMGAGTYFCRLQVSGQEQTRRIVLLR
jgi:poly-gamma-glutamate capsule biosynthesis protein CapA/YwtB (metallophosphatase superfamily)